MRLPERIATYELEPPKDDAPADTEADKDIAESSANNNNDLDPDDGVILYQDSPAQATLGRIKLDGASCAWTSERPTLQVGFGCVVGVSQRTAVSCLSHSSSSTTERLHRREARLLPRCDWTRGQWQEHTAVHAARRD